MMLCKCHKWKLVWTWMKVLKCSVDVGAKPMVSMAYPTRKWTLDHLQPKQLGFVIYLVLSMIQFLKYCLWKLLFYIICCCFLFKSESPFWISTIILITDAVLEKSVPMCIYSATNMALGSINILGNSSHLFFCIFCEIKVLTIWKCIPCAQFT